MNNPKNEPTPQSPSPKTSHDQAGTLLVPAMPPPATIRLLIPESCAWTTRVVAGGVLIDVALAGSTTDLLRSPRGGRR